jgi:hypothetical protein
VCLARGATTIYINGVSAATGTRGGGTLTGDTGNLHVAWDGTTAFAGSIDHIGMDFRPYGAAEILALYRNPFGMFPAGRAAFPPPVTPYDQTQLLFA